MTRTVPNPSTISAHARNRDTSSAAPLGAAAAVLRASRGDACAILAALIVAHGSACRYASCLMRRVPYSKYVLPTAGKPGKTHVSSWLMNAQEAAAVGALCPVGPVEYRDVPETEEETRRAHFSHPSAGMGGVLPPAAR